jgi:hypothetical protein
MSALQKVNNFSFTVSNWRGFWWLWQVNLPCAVDNVAIKALA